MWNRNYRFIRTALPSFLLCLSLVTFNVNSVKAASVFSIKESTFSSVNNFVASVYDVILNLFVKKTRTVFVPVVVPNEITIPVSNVQVEHNNVTEEVVSTRVDRVQEIIRDNSVSTPITSQLSFGDGKNYVEMEFFQNQVETIYNSIYNSTSANITSHEENFTHGDSSSGISFADIALGGTGISTIPNYGELLMGDGLGGYSLVATSSLGLLGGGGSSQWTTAGSDIYYTGGNVGIGTTTAGRRLVVDNNTTSGTVATFQSYATGADVGVRINNNSVSSGSVTETSVLSFTFNDLVGASITGGKTEDFMSSANRSGYLAFNTRKDNVMSEAMRIDTAGNVGIGTTSPAYKLHVYASTGSATQNIQTADASGEAAINLENTVRRWKLKATTAAGDAFVIRDQTAGQDRFVINGAGNTGIGTTSPYAKLSIAGTSIASTTFAIRPISGQTANILDIYNTGGDLVTVIDANGNIGIGTTTPSTSLVVGNGFAVTGSTGRIVLGDASVYQTAPRISVATTTGVLKIIGGTGVFNGAGIEIAGQDVPGVLSGLYGGGSGAGSMLFRTKKNAPYIFTMEPSADVGTGVFLSAIITSTGLGVGTSTPYAKLSVASVSTGTTTFAIRPITSQIANVLDVYDSSGNLSAVITAGGNVGIGSTSPSSKLSVLGDSYFGGNLNIRATGSGPQLTVNALGNGNDTEFILGDGLGQYWGITRENSVGNSARGDLSFYSTDTRAGDLLTLGTRGLVGIGTTSPYAKLSIAGTSIASTTLALRPISGQTANILDVYNTSGVLNTVITAAGSVGIQTTPSAYTSLGIAHSGIEDESSGIEIIRNVQQTANNSSFHFGLDSGIHWNLNGFDQTGDIRASYGGLAISGSGGTATKLSNFYAYTTVSGAANVTNLYGTFASLGNSGTGVVDTITGSLIQNNASGVGTVNNFVGYQVQDSSASTTVKGFVGNVTSGTGKYNMYIPGTAQNYFAGNVGIGTTTPSTKFQAYSSASRYVSLLDTNSTISNIFRVDDNSAANIFTLENRDITATTDHGVDIEYRLSDNSSTAAINAGTIRLAKEQQWTSTASTRDSYLAFSTALDGNTGEKLRITSAGNVGIGTASPDALLGFANALGDKINFYKGSDYGIGVQANTFQIYSPGGSGNRTSIGYGNSASFTSVLNVTGGGNVGIGTTTPDTLLTIRGTGTATTLGQLNTNLRLRTETITVDAGNEISFAGFGGTQANNIYAAISAPVLQNSTGASGYLSFSTKNHSSDTSLSERMRITNSGNVGIGTTSPDGLLHLSGSGAVPQLIISGTAAGSNMKDWRVVADSTSLFLGTLNENTTATGDYAIRLGREASSNDIDYIEFATNNEANKMRYDSVGNLGIGTTSPSQILHTYSGGFPAFEAVATNQTLYIAAPATVGMHSELFFGTSPSVRSSATGIARIQAVGTNTGTLTGDLAFHTNAGASLAERMRITGTGVGIGTTTPGANLDVNGTTRFGGLTVGVYPAMVLNNKSSDASGVGTGLQFKNRNNASNYMGGIQTIYRGGITSALTMMDFFAGGDPVTPKMTLTGSGNLGVGTTTPDAKLHVAMSTGSIPTIAADTGSIVSNTTSSGSSAALSIISGATGFSTLNFGDTADENIGYIQYGHTNNYLALGANTNEYMRLTSTGNIGIGTTSPYKKLSIADTSPAIVLSSTNTNISAGATYGDIDFTSDDLSGGGLMARIRAKANDNNFGGDSELTFWTRQGGSDMSEKMRLTTVGTLNIGTTTVSAMLTVENNTTRNSFIVTDQLLDPTPFVIDNAGNVGIGTSTPGLAKLIVEGTNGTALSGLGISNTANSANSRTYLNFYDNTAENSASIGSVREASATEYGLIFRTGSGYSSSGPSDRMYISAAGNVGIGSTTPLSKLHVFDSSANPVSLIDRGTSGLFLSTYAGVGSGGLVYDNSGNFLINSQANANKGTTNSMTTVFTISGAGNVGIGTTSPWRTLSVDGTVALNGLTSSATGNALCITSAKELTDSGGASCTPSSIRFKENVTTLNPGFALDTISKLKVVNFDYIEKQPFETNRSYGLIAEEVAKIDNNLVDYGYDGLPVSLHFEKITGLLVQAVQEQKAQIEEIKSQSFIDKVFVGVNEMFKTAAVRMKSVFVGELHVQEKLCVDDVCIDKDQLKAILMNSGGVRYIQDKNPIPVESNINTNTNTVSSTTSEVVEPQASTTSQTVPNVVPVQESTTPQVPAPSEQPVSNPTNTTEQTPPTVPEVPAEVVSTPEPEPAPVPAPEPTPTPTPEPSIAPESAPTAGE